MAVSREKALYFEPGDTVRNALVKSVLIRMGIRIRPVAPEEIGQTVGFLLGRKDFAARQQAETAVLDAPLLVLDGLTDQRLNVLLREMKKAGAAVSYKAVATETNLGWLLYQLYEELAAEHEAMQS